MALCYLQCVHEHACAHNNIYIQQKYACQRHFLFSIQSTFVSGQAAKLHVCDLLWNNPSVSCGVGGMNCRIELLHCIQHIYSVILQNRSKYLKDWYGGLYVLSFMYCCQLLVAKNKNCWWILYPVHFIVVSYFYPFRRLTCSAKLIFEIFTHCRQSGVKLSIIITVSYWIVK